MKNHLGACLRIVADDVRKRIPGRMIAQQSASSPRRLPVHGATYLGSVLAALALTFTLLHTCAVAQTPTLLGDLDADTKPTVIDLQRLLNHFIPGRDEFHLVPSLLPYADLNEDGLINTNDVLLLQDAILGRTTLPNPYAAPVVSVPTFSTNGSSITITGVARPNRRILITGGRFAVFANSDSNGFFSFEVQLRANQVNAIYVTATNATFTAGIPQPLRVLQDSQPPNLFIDFPTNGATLYTESTIVAGRVGDSLSGYAGLVVGIRSIPLPSPGGEGRGEGENVQCLAACEYNGMFRLFSLTSFLSRWERRQDAPRPGNSRARDRSVERDDLQTGAETDSLSQRERVRVRESAT